MSRPAGFSDSDSDSATDLFHDDSYPLYGQDLVMKSYNEKEERELEQKGKTLLELLNDKTPFPIEKDIFLCRGDHLPKKFPIYAPTLTQAAPMPFNHLRMAIMDGNLAKVKSFVNRGIKVNQTLKLGWTLVMIAASSGHPDIVNYLLENGADPDRSGVRFTALMAAAASHSADEPELLACVEHLLRYKADINVGEVHGMTALMFAAKAERPAIMKVLLDAGADVDQCDTNDKFTALFWAVTAAKKESIKLLLEYKANPKHYALGQNVIEAARQSGNEKLACLLEKHCMGSLRSEDWKELNDLKIFTLVNQESESYFRYCDVEYLLTSIELESMIPIFRKHKISMEALMHLTEHDLIMMGIHQFGIRFHIMTAIKTVNLGKWMLSCLPKKKNDDSRGKNHTMDESLSVLKNMHSHVRYMAATFSFMQKCVSSYPKLLTIDTKSCEIKQLTESCSRYLTTAGALKNEMDELVQYLRKRNGCPELVRADDITRKIGGVNWKSFSMVSVGIAISFYTLLFFKSKLMK